MAIIEMNFGGPYLSPLEFTLGDTLLISGTPPSQRNDSYIYRFAANGAQFAETTVTGISLETGGGPNKEYVLPDAILQAAPGQMRIEVTVGQWFHSFYSPGQDEFLQERTFFVTLTDTDFVALEAAESAETQAIKARFGAFVQGRSRVAAKITATAPNGSAIRRVDIYEGTSASGAFLGGVQFEPGRESLSNELIPEDAAPAKSGAQSRFVVITDARGRQVSRQMSAQIIAYQPPAILTLSLKRANAQGVPMAGGTYVQVQAEIRSTSIKVDGVEKNTATFIARYRQAGTANAWAEATIPAQAGEFTGVLPPSVQCDLDKSYAFEMLFMDYFTTVSRNTLVPQVYSLLSLHPGGRGLGIGTRAGEPDLMDVALPARFRAVTSFADLLTAEQNMRIQGQLSLDNPLPVASGGTGARSMDELKAQLSVSEVNIQRGQFAFTVNASAKSATSMVIFPKAFAAAPGSVQISLLMATGFGDIQYALSYVTSTYLQFIVNNTATVARSGTMHWVAIG